MNEQLKQNPKIISDEWLQDSKFSKWINKIKEDKAFGKICNIALLTHANDLSKHVSSSMHGISLST